MTDRPMIFSGPMVRALLDGTKTQTRRIVKDKHGLLERFTPTGDMLDYDGNGTTWGMRLADTTYVLAAPCQPGDRYWVRETWGMGVSDHGDCPRYKATMDYMCGDKIMSAYEGPFKWRSPIHMPRRFSRITLVVSDVRPERVQDISAADALAEGIIRQDPTPDDEEWNREWSAEHGLPPDPMQPVWSAPGTRQGYGQRKNEPQWGPTPQFAFRCLWNTIHGPDAWERNDWVWRIEFAVHACNIDRMEEHHDQPIRHRHCA